jgi:hypothetical protein
VNLLTPFQSNPFRLSVLSAAVFSPDTKTLFVKFELQDPKAVIVYSETTDLVGPRKDKLWEETCFEVFLQPVGKESYFEINLSTTGQWNSYEFEKYRTPQPPKACELIELKQFHWNSERRTMTAELQIDDPCNHWRMGLTAVLKSKNPGEVFYFALKHKPEKADFHWSDSFVLQKDR